MCAARAKMALNSEKLLSMYKDKNETSVIIKFKRDEDMRNTLRDLPSTMLFEYNKYESTEVKLSAANAIVRYVRLFNLPPEVEDREISVVMAKFGKIVRMVREKYGEETGFPIWTSVRGVYLELKEGIEIPATVYVRNLRARVAYEGLVNKCYLCGSKDHLKADCPEKKSVNERLQNQQGSSYSGILQAGERWTKKQNKTDNDRDGMVNLGQGRPKRTIVVQQQSSVEQRVGDAQIAECGDDITAVNNSAVGGQLEPDGYNDMDMDDTIGVGNDFIKVTGKRGRKQKSACNGKESASDSDESPTGKVHSRDLPLSSLSLSDSLDRVTRSKSKQRKVSELGDCSSANDDTHVEE